MSERNIIASDKTVVREEPNPLRLILTLAIAGLISGIAIVGIYEATFTTIAENRARELREAVFNVLPGITSMQEYVLQDGTIAITEGHDGDALAVYAGYDAEGQFFGYAIPGAGPGFQDTISLLYGYIPERRSLVGMKVLDSRETPGLGDKIIKDKKFVGQFGELSVDPALELVKGGRHASNEVDAITGATISSRAVVRIINDTNGIWLDKLPDEPPK